MLLSFQRCLVGAILLLGTARSIAQPPAQFKVGFPLEDRAGWAWLAEHPTLAGVVEKAESLIESRPPETPDNLYFEFSKNGNRNNYQKPYYAKRQRLMQLAIAEGIENNRRFLPAIERYVRSVCDERVWCLPAHDRDLRAFKGERAELDLFLSETSWDLAVLARLLQDRLSPDVLKLIDENLERRTFAPYEAILDGKEKPPWWFRTTNNWNAVCLAGITGAALTHLESPERRQRYLENAEKVIAKFLAGFAEDGYCTEGVGYWNFGFGHYLMLGEAIGRSTGGRDDWFAGERVRTIATYPQRILIEPGLTPWFADCRPGTTPSLLLQEFMAAKLGTSPVSGQEYLKSGRPHLYSLATLYPALREGSPRPSTIELPIRDRFDSACVFVLRPEKAATEMFSVALKSGHNGEHHNHNDVGSFVVARSGVAALCDPGGEVYTAATFDQRRYQSPFNNSFGQPVPIVAGEPQSKGQQHRGVVTSTSFTGAVDTVTVDLTAAYKVPALEQLVRKFTYSRGEQPSLVVEDRVRFSSPQSFETALITFEPHQQRPDRTLVVGGGKAAVVVTVESKSGALENRISTLDGVSSSRKPVTRLGFSLKQPATEAVIRTTIKPAS